jgi:CheY-like chemotaxis protein
MSKILLVEDNEMNRDMLVRRLERKGFTVCTAIDGLSGIETAQRERPDLILMDVSLGQGKMDGLEATRRIKADPATAGIPVLALTAHSTTADRQQCLEAGCSDFDTKPVDLRRLLAKMAGLLG